jgi:hypothetical protein
MGECRENPFVGDPVIKLIFQFYAMRMAAAYCPTSIVYFMGFCLEP